MASVASRCGCARTSTATGEAAIGMTGLSSGLGARLRPGTSGSLARGRSVATGVCPTVTLDGALIRGSQTSRTGPLGGTSASVGAGASDDRADGPRKDHEVERQGPVLDVAHIKAHGVIPGEVRASADLPQPRDARLHEQAAPHVVSVLLDLAGDVRSRADE